MTYIAFEGPEGSGKSTQAARLAKKTGALLTREPGATQLGKSIREALLSNSGAEISAESEAILMAADRAQTTREIVVPAMKRGQHVITDRSVYSSFAYQGYGRGLELEYLRELNRLALADVWPQYVVLIDLPAEAAMGRLNRELDRFELAGEDFHQRVNAGYKAMAQANPDSWIVVDGSGSVKQVEERVWGKVRFIFEG